MPNIVEKKETTLKHTIVTSEKIIKKVMSYFDGIDIKSDNNISRKGITIKTISFPEDDWSRSCVVTENEKPIATYERNVIEGHDGDIKQTRYSLRRQLNDSDYVLLQLCEIGEETDISQIITTNYTHKKRDLPIAALDEEQLKKLASIFTL